MKDIFLRLFAISIQMILFISQMGVWNEISWFWQLEWRRVLYEWESEEVRRLKSFIEQKGPILERKDGVCWKNTGLLCYPTKCTTKKINKFYTPSLSRSIVNIVWQKFIPPRANMSVWLANQEKLKTGDFLVEKGIINPQQAMCPFCCLELESNSHILFTCSFAWNSWMEILQWWGLSATLHNRCKKFSIQWFGLLKNRKHRDIWALTLGCVL